MAEVNLFDDEWTDAEEREGYHVEDRRLGESLGAEKIGGTVYLIEPGSRVCPYHWHFGEEEWLIVLEGTAMVRTPDGDRTVSRGGVLAFPTGPGGAHSVGNDGEEPARVLLLSTVSDPEICVYPDSDKIGASGGFLRTDGARARTMNRESANLDYFDGER